MAIILPGTAVRELVDEAQQWQLEQLPEARCPAAQFGRYGDTGKPYIRCGVEDSHAPVASMPLAVMNFCCDQYGNCPSWQAAKDRDEVIERVAKAREQAKQDAITRDQIAAGTRFDDRGEERRRIEADLARARADARASYAQGAEDDFDIRDYLR